MRRVEETWFEVQLTIEEEADSLLCRSFLASGGQRLPTHHFLELAGDASGDLVLVVTGVAVP